MNFDSSDEVGRRNRSILKILGGLTITGIVIGVFVGLVGATLLGAVGIKDTGQPDAASAPTATKPEATPSPTASPSPSAEPEPPSDPTPEVEARPSKVSPGERITLTGSFPDLDGGTTLQVQRREDNKWQDFPVTARTKADGSFSTYVLTSRTGKTAWRMIDKSGGSMTPPVVVVIG